jgi:hypothetical protein
MNDIDIKTIYFIKLEPSLRKLISYGTRLNLNVIPNRYKINIVLDMCVFVKHANSILNRAFFALKYILKTDNRNPPIQSFINSHSFVTLATRPL